MTISIFTIVIVILQVIHEVLRVTSTDQKCIGESTYAIFHVMIQVLKKFSVKVPKNETENETYLIWCNDKMEISCISGFGYYLTMPAFFILIFGVQFRVTRRGITVGGWYALTIACCAILTFITLTGMNFHKFEKAIFISKIWNRKFSVVGAPCW